MTLYDLTKKYGSGKGEEMMWKTVEVISEAVETSMEPEAKEQLMRDVYGKMSGGHYNEEYAIEDVAKMFYKDSNGKEIHAPYWTVQQVKDVYDTISGKIPDYTFWDFYVTLQMIKADNCPLLMRWFPNSTADERDKMLIEMAINWLADPDYPYPGEKIWRYLNY